LGTSKEASCCIVKFIAPDTVGPTKETGVLISIFQRPNENNLDEFIDFFQKNRLFKGLDFTLVNSSESTLAGLKARNIILYEQQENVLDPKSDYKVMRTYAFDNNTHKGYTIRYYSEPGLFNRYLPIAQKMINSFEITNRIFMPALVNNTANNTSNIPEDTISVNKNNTKPFVRHIARNNTVNLASIIIERGSSFPDNARFYSPTNLTIQGNTTVMWTNNDTVLHTVTSGNPQRGTSKFFDSSLLQPTSTANC
jgi:plastocyanin